MIEIIVFILAVICIWEFLLPITHKILSDDNGGEWW